MGNRQNLEVREEAGTGEGVAFVQREAAMQWAQDEEGVGARLRKAF